MLKSSTRTSPLLLILVTTYVSFALLSNILANHMLLFLDFTIDAATLTFPITYILSDIFSEVYGYKWSRRVSWLSCAMNLIFGLMILFVTVLPQPAWYDGTHFTLGVGSSIRIVLSSIICFVAGDFVNDQIFARMKSSHMGMEGFKIRAITSSLFGNLVDTTLFVLLAFFGVVPASEMFPMIGISVCLKTLYELLILPITYKVVERVSIAEEKWNV